MDSKLEKGFSIINDGNQVAFENTFDNAIATANEVRNRSPSTSIIQIRSSSSEVLSGYVASPLRKWNFDNDLSKWVELLQK